MSTFRTGLLLATLLLSACSMPIFKDVQHNSTMPAQTMEQTDSSNVKNSNRDTKQTNAVIIEKKKSSTESKANLIEQRNTQKKLAYANFKELKNRTGKADDLPELTSGMELTEKELTSDIQKLRSYISKTNTEIAALNTRVSDREKIAINGDMIRIFLSEAIVTHDNTRFKAQPLVGQWVRGESRIIRLKDNILFENPKSEDLHITFSERYQLVVNGEIISTINPKREKNNASFNVATSDNEGTIIGKLDYRIVDKQ